MRVVALILAGGAGTRLGVLSEHRAKPAVPFAGRFRIIDFTLSNCVNSGITNVGVLTQYLPRSLNEHIGIGRPWDLDRSHGGVRLMQPYQGKGHQQWYGGTADAVLQNIDFLRETRAEIVVILSGDHIYKMDYNKMLASHIETGADITIAVRPVPWEVASSFGIMNVDPENTIVEFEEKPKLPKSNLASMGVYIFTWPVLRSYLDKDACDPASKNDFGKNVIPAMLHDRLKLKAYAFDGYWKDVGTIESLWEANMDLLKIPPEFNLSDARWPIYARSPVLPPHFIGQRASIEHSMIAEGCEVNGTVRKSVLFYGVEVEKDALVEDSVIMPYARIEAGAVVRRAIVAENCVVSAGCVVGEANGDIALVGQDTALPEGCRVLAGEQVDRLDVARRRHDAK